jgi:hypothetical protein
LSGAGKTERVLVCYSRSLFVLEERRGKCYCQLELAGDRLRAMYPGLGSAAAPDGCDWVIGEWCIGDPAFDPMMAIQALKAATLKAHPDLWKKSP